MKRPFASIGFTYLIALLAAVFLGVGASFALGISCLTLAVLLFCRKSTARRFPVLFLTAAVAFFAYFGVYEINVSPISVLDGADVTVSGTVTELPTEAYGRFYYVIETDSVAAEENSDITNVPQNLKIRISSTNAIELDVYDRLTAKVRLSRPTGSEEGLNARNYYAAKNIYLTGFVYDYQPYTVTSGENRPLYYYALKTREKMTEALRALLPPEQSSLVCGILLGDKSGLSDTVREDFRISGVSHLLAVSGLHMAIIGQFLFWVMLYFGVPRRGSALVSCLGVFCFMAVTGFVPSVVRAGVMSILYLLGIGIRKQADPFNSLGFAMLVMTVPNPFAAGDTGLLLSCSATLGILLLAGKIQACLNRWTDRIGVFRRLFHGVNSILAATLSATIFTSPIVAVTFGELSLIGPLSNILMTYPATLMLLCGFLVSIFYYLPVVGFLAMPFGLSAGILANYLMDCSSWLASLPMASIPVTREVLFALLLGFSVAAVVIVMIRWEGFRLRFATCTAAFFLLCAVFGASLNPEEVLEIGVLNTGNGSSVVLVRNHQAAVLCSGGGNGAYTRIDSYLRSRGIQRLDYLLIPQVDKKTSSGASALIAEYHPEIVLVSDQKLPQDKLRRALENRAGVYYFSGRNQTVLWDDLVISTQANKSESWITLTAGQEKILICPAGGDAADLSEKDRDCNFCIAGVTPENAYGIRGDYSILTMYQEEAEEARRAFLNIQNHELVTSKQGNVILSVLNDGVRIHTQY